MSAEKFEEEKKLKKVDSQTVKEKVTEPKLKIIIKPK